MLNELDQQLAERYRGCELVDSDGVALELVERAERSLGLVFPAAVREYYVSCGRNARFSQAHNFIRPVESIAIEDGRRIPSSGRETIRRRSNGFRERRLGRRC
jgi:hypothetical protein